jgi:hemerythrin-like metal-binding protein
MAELIFYTQDHLLREEEIMAAVGYPELAEHKQSHVVVLAHLNALQRQFNQGSFTTATDLTELLKEWLGSHIREADGHLRRFLQDGQKTAQ